jgi:hypothetical protein
MFTMSEEWLDLNQAVILTEYHGHPVLVMDSSRPYGREYLLRFGGAAAAPMKEDGGIRHRGEVWVGHVIVITSLVYEALDLQQLGAVLAHEARHIERGDVVHDDISTAEKVEMEIDCDNAGKAIYGSKIMANAIFNVLGMVAKLTGDRMHDILIRHDAAYPGRLQALLEGTGKGFEEVLARVKALDL